MIIKEIEGGVCAPKGFKAGAINCGIKKSGKMDLTLIVSEKICNAASVYTQNKIKGAPITVTKNNLSNGKAKAIICNSGNANTCAPNGIEIAEKTCELVGKALNCHASNVIVASTGIIGEPMSIKPFESGIPKVVEQLSIEGGHEVAKGIMTTDTVPKEYTLQFEVGEKICKIGAIAKGSGMIHPNMATMLCFVTSDINISSEMLHKALSNVVKTTFNQISVDGDTSTNDMVSIMCNGLAENKEIKEADEAYKIFEKALEKLMAFLAKSLAKDGEGAGKLMEVEVINAPSEEIARLISKSVVSSSLFKAALFGEDANWGRALCAMGYVEADFNVENIDMEMESNFGKLMFCKASGAIGFSEEEASKILKAGEIKFTINLNHGQEKGVAWGCDLTYDYVKINGDYRS